MAISRDDVLHVAKLAELELSELDLADIPPTSHPLAVVNVFRPDESRPSLPLEDVFANAPEREDDFFRVPPSARND